MKESIMIVIAAIVILVIALVLLTIFGQGIGGPSQFASQANVCRSTAASSCQLTGQLPPDWGTARYRIVRDM